MFRLVEPENIHSKWISHLLTVCDKSLCPCDAREEQPKHIVSFSTDRKGEFRRCRNAQRLYTHPTSGCTTKHIEPFSNDREGEFGGYIHVKPLYTHPSSGCTIENIESFSAQRDGELRGYQSALKNRPIRRTGGGIHFCIPTKLGRHVHGRKISYIFNAQVPG